MRHNLGPCLETPSHQTSTVYMTETETNHSYLNYSLNYSTELTNKHHSRFTTPVTHEVAAHRQHLTLLSRRRVQVEQESQGGKGLLETLGGLCNCIETVQEKESKNTKESTRRQNLSDLMPAPKMPPKSLTPINSLARLLDE